MGFEEFLEEVAAKGDVVNIVFEERLFKLVGILQKIAQPLAAAKVPYEAHVYEGAPHSFFDRSYEQWKDACDDAWRRMVEFVKKHT